MEKLGERSLSDPFTFKYPGREPKNLKSFLLKRPDVLDHYIYDVNLTTGSLLYLSKGGIGVTKEPYISKIHQWIQTPNAVSTLQFACKTRYKDDIGKWKFNKLKETFNESGKDLNTWTECAELYLLWAGSNYTHRYRDTGYDGIFFPTKIDYEGISLASQMSRDKKLLFRKEDLFTFKESIVNDNVVIYSHLPKEFGKFGAGWKWNSRTLSRFIRVINELLDSNYKVLI